MSGIFGESLLPGPILKAVEEVMYTTSRNLSDLIKAAGLQPASDFRYADLSGVDFSGVNFSGFDLTGADLRGAYGVGVTNIDKACIDDADVTGSLFEFTQTRLEIFNRYPSLKEQASRLLGKSWIDQHDWIRPALDRVKKGEDELRVLAQTLLEEADDLTVQKSILYFMEDFFSSTSEWSAYIRHMLATKPSDHPVFEHAAMLYAFDFMAGDEACDILKILLRHPNFTVKRYALSGLSRSRDLTKDDAERIAAYVEGPSFADYRRELLLRNARLLNHISDRFQDIATIDQLELVRDFLEPLRPGDEEMMARHDTYVLPMAHDRVEGVEAHQMDRLERRLTELWKFTNITFTPQAGSRLARFYERAATRPRTGRSEKDRARRFLEWTPIGRNQTKSRKQLPAEPDTSLKNIKVLLEEAFPDAMIPLEGRSYP